MLRFALTVLGAAALFAGAARAEMKTQWVEYSHGDAKLKGYLAYDDSATGKRPAILMIHDRAGMQPYTLKHAETYAALGYVVFAADFCSLIPAIRCIGRHAPALLAVIQEANSGLVQKVQPND